MRELALDTETTGFNPDDGDRMVEIGIVELIDFVPSGKRFHAYINPERSVPAEAVAIHGLDDAFLADKPVLAEVVDDFLAFVGEDRLVIHNAAFDMKFINAELRKAGRAELPMERVVDTMEISKKMFPGGVATLDALCRRMGVDATHRTLHGALLDADLLASAYMELNGGRAPRFELAAASTAKVQETRAARAPVMPRPNPLPPRISAEEMAAHEAFVKSIEKKSGKIVWEIAPEEPEMAGMAP